jgi:hypothetical protein
VSPENALLVIDMTHVHVRELGPLWMGGHWHAYATPSNQVRLCPHAATYVSSYRYVCVLIPLYMCPHTAMYVSSYCIRHPQ